MVEDTRIQALNERAVRDGAYVLYWMQQAQRASGNAAIEVAVAEAQRVAEQPAPAARGRWLRPGRRLPRS